MQNNKIKHLMYVPFTGLGLHNGYRGDAWLKNRIKIFKQFVVPSLLAQTNQNFIIWVSWRREERYNPQVLELRKYLQEIFPYRSVFTYAGVCFYDDKYPDAIAQDRLVTSIHGSMPNLMDFIGDCDNVLMTIQPSDDLYHVTAVEGIQKILNDDQYDAVGFPKGYICNYNTREVSEYNPETNPPFYTIKFSKATFMDPFKHAQFTALKTDSGKYKKGTPLPSHEYVGQCLRYVIADFRGFLVGTHGVNISTTFTNPYKGDPVPDEVLKGFGIYDVPVLKVKIAPFNKILLKFPYKVQRKVRYISNEWKFFKLSTWPGLIK